MSGDLDNNRSMQEILKELRGTKPVSAAHTSFEVLKKELDILDIKIAEQQKNRETIIAVYR